MFSIGWILALIGALAGLIGYFLPWIVTSVPGFSMSLNGWQATFGVNVQHGEVSFVPFWMIVVLLAPFAVGFLFYRYVKRGGVLRKVEDVFALGGIGAVTLVLLLIAPPLMGPVLGIGWKLCLLATLAWLGGALLNFQKSQKPV